MGYPRKNSCQFTKLAKRWPEAVTLMHRDLAPHNRIPLLKALWDLFLVIFIGQGVVAVKKDALLVELDLLDTVHCPRIIAVLDGPYCAKVGLLFSPFLTPRCCPNKFSTISELRKLGFMLFSH